MVFCHHPGEGRWEAVRGESVRARGQEVGGGVSNAEEARTGQARSEVAHWCGKRNSEEGRGEGQGGRPLERAWAGPVSELGARNVRPAPRVPGAGTGGAGGDTKTVTEEEA